MHFRVPVTVRRGQKQKQSPGRKSFLWPSWGTTLPSTYMTTKEMDRKTKDCWFSKSHEDWRWRGSLFLSLRNMKPAAYCCFPVLGRGIARARQTGSTVGWWGGKFLFYSGWRERRQRDDGMCWIWFEGRAYRICGWIGCKLYKKINGHKADKWFCLST